MIILGIETSCDETAAAIFDGKKVLSSQAHTQQIHGKYGGVVPELASREHLIKIVPIVTSVMEEASVGWDDIEGIAVTSGPGLIGSLLIGVSYAKSVAFSRNIPITEVNHIEAHLWAPMLDYPEIEVPFIGVIISGGHTQIWHVEGEGKYNLVGQTIDDAVGESFDKVAQMLDLGYPGGPEVDKLSKFGDSKFHQFPRPKVKNRELDFSYSGLKTSVLYYLDKLTQVEINEHKADIAASFQQAVVDSLTSRALTAAAKFGVKSILLGGGVAANSQIKSEMTALAEKKNIKVYTPSIHLCTDNAAMIAFIGHKNFVRGKSSDLSFSANPSLKLTSY